LHRFQATQADVSVFESLVKPPTAGTPNLLRWYNHINSFGDERKKFPGEKKAPITFGDEAMAIDDKVKDYDDDVDLFGSDDDVSEI
jgi:hypothetical protein